MEEDSNQLIEAPEDDDIDDLNDLTFGNTTDNFDADWERHHEELAYSGYDASHLSGYPDDNDDGDFDELQLQETDLKYKLSQLVVDDDDNDDLPTNSVPIKRQPVSLDELFGPQSPPGLFDAEELAMGHPNIWGSPARDSHVPGSSNELHSLLRTLLRGKQGDKETAVGGAQDSTFVPGSARTLEEIEQALLQGSSGSTPLPPTPRQKGGPRVLTVEELERQLRGESSTTPADIPPDGVAPVTSAPGVVVNLPPARVPGLVTLPFGLSALRMAAGGGGGLPNNSSMSRTGSNGRYPHPPHQLAQQMHQPPPPYWNNKNMPVPQRLMNNQAFNRLMGPHMNQRYPMPPGYPGFPFNACGPMAASMMRHAQDSGQFGQHRHFMPMPNDRPPYMNAMRPGHGVPSGMFPPGLSRGQPPQNTVFPLQRQQMFQQMQMRQRAAFHHASGGGGPIYPGMQQPRQWQMSAPRGSDMASDDGGDMMTYDDMDEYAGLMTQREKDWVIKIQMLQLHTDNPYVDDYYFTCWSLKKMLKERQQREGLSTKSGDDSEPTLVLPQLAKVEMRTYMPAHFEGALGRLTSSSIHNPRQIITVDVAHGSETDETRGIVEVKRFKELLLRIEKGFESLLDIEDTEKKAMAQPQENRKALFDERKLLIGQLYRRLKDQTSPTSEPSAEKTMSEELDDDSLAQIITVRKGLYLTLRLTPLLDKPDAQSVICLLLRKMAVRKEWQAEMLAKVYKVVAGAIQSSDLEALVLYASTLCRGDVSSPSSSSPDKNSINRLVSTLQSTFGVSVTLGLLSRGETVYTTLSPLDMDASHQNEWRQFVETVGSAVEICDKSSLAPTLETFPLASAHLRRMLDKRSMLLIEDRLEPLSQRPVVTSPSPPVTAPVT